MLAVTFVFGLLLFLANGAPIPTAPPLPSDWADKLNETESGSGNVYFEDDMILPRSIVKQAVDDGKIKIKNEGGTKMVANEDGTETLTEEITAPVFMRWPNGVVPYVIHDDLKCRFLGCLISNPEKAIKNAMKDWSDNTCITFRERRRTDKDYIHFVNADIGVCASHVGRTRGRQPIYLGKGCRQVGIIIHEIAHALGFFHEQSRPDRDQYITVKYDNIQRKYWMNFQKYSTGISNMGTEYDYGSIMHYGEGSFAKSMFLNTIKPKKSGVSIGQRDRLSPIDIKEANLLYHCPKK